MNLVAKKFCDIILCVIVVCFCFGITLKEAFAEEVANDAATSSTYTIVVPESLEFTQTGKDPYAFKCTVPVTMKGTLTTDEHIDVSTNIPYMVSEDGERRQTKITKTPSTSWWSSNLVNDGTTREYELSVTLAPGTWTGHLQFYCIPSTRIGKQINEKPFSIVQEGTDISNTTFNAGKNNSIFTVDDKGVVTITTHGYSSGYSVMVQKKIKNHFGEDVTLTYYQYISTFSFPEFKMYLLDTTLKQLESDGITVDSISLGEYDIPTDRDIYTIIDSKSDGLMVVAFLDDNGVLKVTNVRGGPLTFTSFNSSFGFSDYEKKKIKNINYDNVDTSHFSSMQQAYSRCTALETITGLENAISQNHTNFRWMFDDCSSLTKAPDMSKVKFAEGSDFYHMFDGCRNLTDLSGLSDIDMTPVSSVYGMFYNCTSLADLMPLSSWDTSKILNMSELFYSCTSLTDLSGIDKWDVSSVQKMNYMFCDDRALVNINALQNWETSSLQELNSTFANCN